MEGRPEDRKRGCAQQRHPDRRVRRLQCRRHSYEVIMSGDSTRSDIPPVPGSSSGGQWEPTDPVNRKVTTRPPAKFELSRLTTADRVVAVASLVAVVSIFLPYYSASAYGITVTASGTTGHGWLWLEFVVGLVLVAYLAAVAVWEHLPFSSPAPHASVLLVGTIVQAGLIVVALVAIPYSDDGVGLGWGAILGLIAALAALGVLVVPAFLRARANNGTQA
jgi:hypothetical protein